MLIAKSQVPRSLMKRIIIWLLLLTGSVHARYIADPIVRYKIDARLDAQQKTVTGHEVITWKNQTRETVPDLQFHLYLNAFKNNRSTFMREGGSRRPRTFRLSDASWGYQQIHNLKVDGQDLTAKFGYIQPDDGNPDDQTVGRVLLPKPIAPGQSVTIEIEWTSKLPRIFARTGYKDNFYLLAQWFPKPGVYEAAGERHRPQGGWNCHQFHSVTEFYADYGVFDANLTVPADFEIGATGTLRSQKQNGDGTTTYNFYQEDVHDFAWTSQPRTQMLKVVRQFKADEQTTPAEIAEWSRQTGYPPDEVKLEDVQVTLLIQRERAAQIERHFRAIFNAIKWFGLFYGKYPYAALTVVDPAWRAAAGGMEYPTFITAGTSYWPAQHALSPEGVTVHEFGHQFWYGLVGNNEFEEAWLDEGFNSYSTSKVLQRSYPPGESYLRFWGLPIPAANWVSLPAPRYPWYGVGEMPLGQYFERVPQVQMHARDPYYARWASADAMERNAWQMLNASSYGVQAYDKPEYTLMTLESLLGEVWPRVIRTYHQRYRFKHPDAIDFINTVKEVSGRDMKWFFDQTVHGTGMLNYSVTFTSGPPRPREGLFDQGGKPTYIKERDEKEEGKEVESEVLVRRLGEMQFPVTIRVRFEDGSERREAWDGLYRWTKIKFSGKSKIASAEIDPDYQWKLEVHRTDNSYLSKPVRLAAEKWYLRWVVWIQNVLMGFSLFS